MAERDFKAAMMADPVLAAEAGLAGPETEDAGVCPVCGASVKKIEAATSGGEPPAGPMGGGMGGGMMKGGM